MVKYCLEIVQKESVPEMFKKLVSNLPFNPSLISQIAFYTKRMHQEEALRRIGFVLTILAMMVQLVAYIAPPTPTLASSNNDIVHGGGTKADILAAYRANNDSLDHHDIRSIMEHFLGPGAESAISNGIEETIVSTPETNYWSVGRTLRDGNDIPLSVPGAETSIYQRTLHDWPGSNGATWRAIRVTSSVTGQEMWILEDCGNIVTKGPFSPQPPSVRIKKVSNPVPGTTVKPGDSIMYSVVFNNSGPGQMINTNIYDTVPSNTTYVNGSIGGGANSVEGTTMHWWPDTPNKVWGVDANDWPVWYSVRIDDSVADGTQICNDTAKITWSEPAGDKELTADPICHTVQIDRCPDGSPIPSTGQCVKTCPDGTTVSTDTECPVPQELCPDGSVKPENGACYKICVVDGSETSIPQDEDCPLPQQTATCDSLQEVKPINSRLTRRFIASGVTSNGGTITEFMFDHDGDGKDYKIIPAGTNTSISFDYVYPEDQNDIVYESILYAKTQTNGQTNITSNAKCAIRVTVPKPQQPASPLITRSKSAKNNTKNGIDANNTTAKSGDSITYILTISNIGDGDAKQHQLPAEDLTDVLEYADIINLGDGVISSSSKHVTWEPVNIEAGQSITKAITVKIKNPIPTTPISTSDVQSFDLIMQNSYGNDVQIKIQKPIVKQVEGVATTLPNTGAGTGLVIGFIITSLVAYLLARSRLLARELDIIRAEYAAGGF